jgi:hypothetical protein
VTGNPTVYLVDQVDRIGRGKPLTFAAISHIPDRVYKNYFEGRTAPPEKLVLVRESGSVACDFHTINNLRGPLVSSRFVKVARAHGLRGWDCFRAKAYGRDGELLGGYFGLVVLGRAGRIDRSLVRTIRRRNELGRNEQRWAGFDIRPEDLDGSDLFFAANTGCILYCSDKARRALQGAALAGLELPLLRDVEWSHDLGSSG